MALTRLTGANAISGEIPAANFNNASLTNITALPSSIATGDLQFISKQTASSSASISFTSGIDSTYKEYVFYFNNIHPSASAKLTFNFSTDSGSNYNVTKTTTSFYAYHNESGADALLTYTTGNDLAQGTGFVPLTDNIATSSSTVNNDDSASGYLHLFNPSSSVFVKHYLSTLNHVNPQTYAVVNYHAGYGNTTSSIDAIQFKMSSGDIDSGDILLYGVK